MQNGARSADVRYVFKRLDDENVPDRVRNEATAAREFALMTHFTALHDAGVISGYHFGLEGENVVFTIGTKGKKLPRYVERGLIEIYHGKKVGR